MQDDEIQLLYVEYSFLGHRGEDMETVSVRKPTTANQEMFYNFKKSKSIIYIYKDKCVFNRRNIRE